MTGLLIVLGMIFGIILFVDILYKNIDITHYSPRWEYFLKAFLYGLITVFTMIYGKNTLADLSPVEWAIVAVSAIEGTGNYINYIKETKKVKESKGKA